MFRPLGTALILLAIQANFTAHLAPLMGATATMFSYALCFGTYAFILYRLRDEPQSHTMALAIAVAAILVRIMLTFAEPELSDDIFRYVWEGRVTLAGYNPFVHAPDAGVLESLRDAEIWPLINHPHVPTIYPPIAQLLFAGVALVGGGTTVLRLAFVALEALMVLGAWHIAGEHPRRTFGLALYALNPLVMLEVAWSGHLDVLAWGGLTLSLLLVTRTGWRAHAAAGALLGVSIGAKLLGVILLPYLLLRGTAHSWRTVLRDRAVLLACTMAVVLSGYALFAGAGGKLFGGFGTYAASWRSNDGVFRAWDTMGFVAMQGEGDDERKFEFPKFNELAIEHGVTKEWQGKTLPNTTFVTTQVSQAIAKFAAAAVVGIVLLFCIVVVRDPFVAALAVLGALYLVAPTVHPWYVAWLVPLAALRPNATTLAFSAAVLAAYAAWMSHAAGGAWTIPWWVVASEYGLVFCVLVWEIPKLTRSNR